MIKILVSALFAFSIMANGVAAEFIPENAGDCFPLPGKPAKLMIKTSLKDGTGCDYLIRDYSGRNIFQGNAAVASGKIKIDLNLKQGYYEIVFPSFGRIIGVIALPGFTSENDGFWCIDAGLSWSKWKSQTKKEMVRILLNRGISGFRERLDWPKIESSKGITLDGGNIPAYVRDSVYTGKAKGRILELFQNSPSYIRRDKDNPFSIKLEKGFDSWKKIAARFSNKWSALELWNEPFFVKGLPADQYVPVAKMVSAAVADVPVVGGCFSPSISLVYINNCADNGLLDIVNAITLHLYGKPETMPELIPFYINWLKRNGHADLPIWVSESGSPTQISTMARPDITDDGASARSTVMRAIECKAFGVRRFYAFYLQRHIEGVIAWGMTDAVATPQRGLAAWLNAARTIGNLKFIGDLKDIPAGVVSAHAFGDGKNAVLALYSPGRSFVNCNLPYRSITGIDGRDLSGNNKNGVPVPDGLAYLFFKQNELEHLLNHKCPAMSSNLAAGSGCAKRQLRTIIIQPEYNRIQTAQVSNLGYFLKPDEIGKFKISAYVYNLSGGPQSVDVTLNVPGVSTEKKIIKLDSPDPRRVEWTVDLRQALTAAKAVDVYIIAKGEAGNDQAVVTLRRQPAGKIYQAIKCGEVPVIDGIPDDKVWNRSNEIDKLTCMDDSPNGKPADSNGLDGRAKFLWNDTGLYFLIRVHDRMHEPARLAALSWQKDSVQIAIHQANSPQDVNSFEWGFFLDDAGISRVTLFRSSIGMNKSGTTKVAVRRNDKSEETVYEGLITWLDLGSMQAINDRLGMRFRMSFIINDANGGKRRWLEWSPGIAKDKNTSSYPEIILSDDNNNPDVGNLPADVKDGWTIPRPKWIKNTDYRNHYCIKMKDKPGVSISRTVKAIKSGRPLELSFKLAIVDYYKNKCTGFSFKAKLFDDKTKEGIECWIAPRPIYANTSCFVLADHDGTLIKIGSGKIKFKPDGKFSKITMLFDPESRAVKLYLDCDGVKKLIAEGHSKRAIESINRLEFSSSGWGSGPLMLTDISLK